MAHTETLTLRRFIAKSEEKTYPEVPFAVGDDVERIEVRYAYARPDGRTVVDIGLRSPERIVGWSGGARSSFFVGLDTATPGYLAGPLPPGEWRILLGAYRIPDEGCEVEIAVSVARTRPRWLKGDLHMHGVHSDGAYEIAEAIRVCKEKGLDFAAFTDHNNASQNLATLAADDRLVLLPGVELTSYSGHANLLGQLDALDDFRVRTPEQAAETLRRGREKGALVSLNHPFCPDCPWELGFDVPYDAIEVWNGPWRELNETAVRWWHDQLAAGRRVVAIGGSDTHAPHPLVAHGVPTTYVRANAASKSTILHAIRQGRVVLSFAPDETFIELTAGEAGIGDTLKTGEEAETELGVTVRGAAGDVVRVWSDRGLEAEWTAEREDARILRLPADRLFYRAEAYRYLPEWGRTILSCLTNPIYLRGAGEEDEAMA